MGEALALSVFKLIQDRRSVTMLPGAPYFKGSARAKSRVALCVFELKRPPAFAPTAAELTETRFGFCCLIESKKVLAVAHAGFAWSDSLLPLTEPTTLSQQDAAAVLGSMEEPRVDKVSTRSMSASIKSIHARTLEGDDLEASIPSLGASRHVVSAVRTVEGTTGATLSLTPGSSRLTQLGPRSGLKEMVSWVGDEMVTRLGSGQSFRFLSRFAEAIRFDDLPASVEPTGISLALDLPGLDGLDWQFQGAAAGAPRAIVAHRMARIFNRLRLVLGSPKALSSRGNRLVAQYPPPIGDMFLNENKRSYSIENAFLRRLHFMDADTQVRRSLLSALNETRAFLVTFSDLQYAYVASRLVRTAHVSESLATVLGAVQVYSKIANATSEKGKLSGRIDPRSLFGLIESQCAKADAVLLLDDGGAEWADYIGVADPHSSPIVSFYHAKYTGKPSASASVLQEVIGQAEKNIGWLTASPDVLEDRARRVWAKPYKWPAGGSVRRIRRKIKNQSVAEVLCEVAANPKTRRRVCIVASSLTQAKLAELATSSGKALKPYEAQLAWLLSVFVSSCAEAGVEPVIMCPK
jgi:hypothetical protein